ncbi:hypothetical protein BpHYR1_041345 [Brachionus plicatilis]|uniref:Uncharacterized protein n=1 Tax=Brachionus plicatilis TaxID=10195 RepID=A0A3M7PMI6_BRAPC|nr:hypothetical protein BpHYR1_041345 [Brachionus plicatilis]
MDLVLKIYQSVKDEPNNVSVYNQLGSNGRITEIIINLKILIPYSLQGLNTEKNNLKHRTFLMNYNQDYSVNNAGDLFEFYPNNYVKSSLGICCKLSLLISLALLILNQNTFELEQYLDNLESYGMKSDKLASKLIFIINSHIYNN